MKDRGTDSRAVVFILTLTQQRRQFFPDIVQHQRFAGRHRVKAVFLHQGGLQSHAVEQERHQPHPLAIAAPPATLFACDSTTAFGFPVVPDVMTI